MELFTDFQRRMAPISKCHQLVLVYSGDAASICRRVFYSVKDQITQEIKASDFYGSGQQHVSSTIRNQYVKHLVYLAAADDVTDGVTL